MLNHISIQSPLFPKHPHPIRPIFLPGAGCPSRCVYCNQPQQTGTPVRSLQSVFQHAARDLRQAFFSGSRPFELAFFGGTFTALPRTWQHKFLHLAQAYRDVGLITAVRCSTRPDFCSGPALLELATWGLNTVEIGAQSFQRPVLERSNRGYSPEAIHAACARVKDAGLHLGLQFLPGLPGHTYHGWLRDVRNACGIRPDFVRIYPCLVFQNTPLHALYDQGQYAPWSLDRCVRALARGYIRFWRAGVPVIRMGLHPEPAMLRAMVAGPWHPALGGMVKSRVLLALITSMCQHLPPGPKALDCPQRLQGDLWGYRGQSSPRLLSLGIAPQQVRYNEGSTLYIRTISGS